VLTVFVVENRYISTGKAGKQDKLDVTIAWLLTHRAWLLKSCNPLTQYKLQSRQIHHHRVIFFCTQTCGLFPVKLIGTQRNDEHIYVYLALSAAGERMWQWRMLLWQ